MSYEPKIGKTHSGRIDTTVTEVRVSRGFDRSEHIAAAAYVRKNFPRAEIMNVYLTGKRHHLGDLIYAVEWNDPENQS